MSDPLDRRIRSAVVELVESSPPPHPAHEALQHRSRRPSPLSLGSGLARMTAVAVVVLLLGLAGGWLARNLASPVGDIPIVEGSPSPEPNFDPALFGEEVGLLPSSGALEPDIAEGTLDGDVVAVGRVQGTDLEAFTWDTVDDETCIQVVGPEFEDSSCSREPASGRDPEDPLDVPEPFVTTRFNSETGASDVIVVWQVPDETSIVRLLADDDPLWQRPNSGVVALAFDPDTKRAVLDATNSEGLTVAVGFVSPRQIMDPVQPGTTEVEGAPEDLIQLDDTHPVKEIISAGATDVESFARAARDRGLQGTCGGGEGGTPSHEYCLVGLDGVLVVVPLGGEPGLTIRISDTGLVRDVVIPLDRTEPVGVANLAGGGVPAAGGSPARVEYLGEEIGTLTLPSIR